MSVNHTKTPQQNLERGTSNMPRREGIGADDDDMAA